MNIVGPICHECRLHLHSRWKYNEIEGKNEKRAGIKNGPTQ